jgi:regulator of cell morphogenesis and NO signaling
MTATSATIGRKCGERGCDGGRPDLLDGEAGHPIREVCDHVQAAGHDPLKARLYRLRLTMLMVADAHGARHPELGRALTVFARFAADLEAHLAEEEHVVFPLVESLEAAAPLNDVLARLAGLEAAHGRLGEALDELRALTGGYAAPADACVTYRALMDDLRGFEAGFRATVAEESDVLFPRAARLAGRRPAPAATAVETTTR